MNFLAQASGFGAKDDKDRTNPSCDGDIGGMAQQTFATKLKELLALIHPARTAGGQEKNGDVIHR